MTTDQPPISLLWHDGYPSLTQGIDKALINDLNLRRLVRALSIHPEYETYVQSVLLTLTTDKTTIAYRQAFIADLLRNPELFEQLHSLLDEIITLESYFTTPQWKDNILRQVAWRLSELERYVDTVLAFHEILQAAGDKLQSSAFLQLRTRLQAIVASELFQHLRAELPVLLPQIRNIRSITIGINLDPEMRPISARLLGINTEALLTNESILTRLFGWNRDAADNLPLHNARHIAGIPSEQIELRNRNSPFMPQLFKDLSELLDETSRPIANTLHKYTQVSSQFLIALKRELAFYMGAVKLIQRLQAANLPLCQPTILDTEQRTVHLEGLYNINLALQHLSKQRHADDIVCNDVNFNDDGRIFILTGPNQGGKTTYTQAVGLAQIMFQAGLHVPASAASLSPVDAIYTHFAAEERPNLEAGRLGEESRRLNMIFQQATRHSLILLNESLASTAASESLYLAQDVIKAFRLLGARVIFATHLLDLAASADDLNAAIAGDSRVISMVSQIEETQIGEDIHRTYRIIPAPPMSKSYAIELAARYGISFEQLHETLKKRDIL